MTAPNISERGLTPTITELAPSVTLPTDFSTWTVDNAQAALDSRVPQWLAEMRLFIMGEHFYNGQFWVGPIPKPGDEGYQETVLLIQNGFVSRNVLAEVSERYTNGLVGTEPYWNFGPRRPMKKGEKPTDVEQRLIDEVIGFMVPWWDDSGIGQGFWDAVYRMTWGQRGPMRLGVVPGAAVTQREGEREITGILRTGGDMAKALRLLFLDTPDQEVCTVYRHPLSRMECGIYFFKESESGPRLAQLSYLDPNGRTVTRIVGRGGDAESAPTTPVEMGGYLPVHDPERPRLLTTQAVQLQKNINLALSMVPRTLITAGFLERTVRNAEISGRYEDVGGRRVWKPDPLTFGAGRTVTLTGLRTVDPTNGRETLATPDVSYREPISPKSSIEAKEALYEALLEEVDQAHVLMNADANASGRSREQARADYENSLGTGEVRVNRAGRWLLGMALVLAEQIAGIPGRYSSQLRPVFSCRLDTGPIDAEEARLNAELGDKGYLARESVMSRNRVTDIENEEALLAAQPGANLGVAEKQAGVFAAWVDAGVPLAFAGRKAGLPDDEIAELEEVDEEAAERERQAAEAAAAAGDAAGGQSAPPGGSQGPQRVTPDAAAAA